MLTLGKAKTLLASKPSWRGVDPVVMTDLINEACELLLDSSRPKDSLDRLGITVHDETITLPRNYAACVGLLRNDVPLHILNGWIEFVLTGPGNLLDSDQHVYGQAIDMGDGYCVFKEPVDVHEDGCILKFYTDADTDTEEAESIIEIHGLDSDGDEIRTTPSGTSIRTGEAVALLGAAGSVSTTSSFAKITQVVKPNTQGIISVKAVNPDDSVETLIAKYAPTEKLPNYRRYKVPESTDDPYVVQALCRERFIPVEQDGERLCTDSFNSLVNAMLHIQYRDANDEDRAKACMERAIKMLSSQAAKYRPAGQYPVTIHDLDGLNKPLTGY